MCGKLAFWLQLGRALPTGSTLGKRQEIITVIFSSALFFPAYGHALFISAHAAAAEPDISSGWLHDAAGDISI